MEYQKPHEIFNRCIEARGELRQHPEIDAALTERTSELPEDDFCSHSREALQLGAGYAYLRRHEAVSLEEAFALYFATQPQNRYLDHEVIELERKTIAEAALELFDTNDMPELESHIDPYAVGAASAFIAGYVTVTNLLSS